MKDVFLEPYFMLYGEVYAGKIDRKLFPYLFFRAMQRSGITGYYVVN